MFERSIELLTDSGVKVEAGLSVLELSMAEDCYGLKFPGSLHRFLSEALPVSKGFYNWRNFEEDNIRYIKSIISRPAECIDLYADEAEWGYGWGPEPKDREDRASIIREKLKQAPALIPVFSHRYMPVTGQDDPPVLSVCGTDIIYYGADLKDYLEIEFGDKVQQDIRFDKIRPVPFWTEIM